MTNDTPISLSQRLGGNSPETRNIAQNTSFTESLHHVIAEGGLSVEREIHDWVGADRFDSLLQGAEPTAEEAAFVERQHAQLVSQMETESFELMEPIAPGIAASPTGQTTSVFGHSRATLVGVSAAALVSVIALTIAGMSIMSATAIREDAAAAEAFSARLVTTLAEELPQEGQTPVLEELASDALAYFQTRTDIRDPQTLREWSRLFTVVGRQRWNAGDTAGAREALQAALVATERGLEISPRSLNANFDLSQSVFWLASLNYENGDFDAAELGFERYAGLTSDLYAADPEQALYQAEYAYGYLNTATIDWERGRYDDALSGFTIALNALQDVAERDSIVGASDIANARAWRGDALFVAGRFDEAIEEQRAQIALYEATGTGTRADTGRLLSAIQHLANTYMAIGEIEVADELVDQALGLSEQATNANQNDIRTMKRYLGLLAARIDVNLAQGRLFAAKLLVDEAREVQTAGLQATDRIPYPREVAGLSLRAGRIALQMSAPRIAMEEANGALRVLGEVERPDIYSSLLIAESYELIGQIDEAAGRPDLALRSWQQGLQALESLPNTTIIDAIRSRLLHQSGDVENSMVVRARVQNAGYAHPYDTAFWEAVDLPSVAQRTGDIQTDDG